MAAEFAPDVELGHRGQGKVRGGDPSEVKKTETDNAVALKNRKCTEIVKDL